MSAFSAGVLTGLSLILAIGAQNAFVLRQGLLRRHVFGLCLFCATSDAVLIAAGVAGFGAVAQQAPWVPPVMTLGGALFLLAYGARRFHAAWRGSDSLTDSVESVSLRQSLGLAAAFTWLNPHVYVDTLALIGAVSTRHIGPAKLAFGAGAALASFVFFFALGYGARLLAPVMARPRAWQVLDSAIGLTMWVLAFGLLRHLWSDV